MSKHSLPNWHSTFSAAADTARATVHARGVLDLFTADLLRGAVDVLRTAGRRDVLLDLTNVTAIDRTGVLLLAAMQRDFSTHDGSLSLVHPAPNVQSALRVAHLAWRPDGSEDG